MRAIISERLRLSLHQRGKGVLTVTLHAVRCACETTFRDTFEADAPRNPGQYTSFVQDGIRISYSSRFDGMSDVLAGPDELLARLIMGLVEPQNLTLGKQRPNAQ